MKTLKEKTIQGVFWSFIQNFSTQITGLIIGIILARLLSPREFGLVGMLTIFIELSKVLINSGIVDALIRDPEIEEKDYATAFIFNIAFSIFLYTILFTTAPLIGDFYDEPLLKPMVRVLSLSLIINALTLVHRTRLIKAINFKLLTKIDVISVVCSGLIGIGMAWYGFGVWSLVAKTVLMGLISVSLIWVWARWRPSLTFNKSSFKKLFSFGSRLAILGVIDTIYLNMYYLIIGKEYSATQLGFYTQAERFKNFPSKGITGIVQQVTYPVLSEIQADTDKLKRSYKKLIKMISLISITLLIGLASIAENLIKILLGNEWVKTGEYLEILCFVAIFYPLNSLNINIMKVKGRSALILNLGILKKITTIPVILAAIFISIKAMLMIMIGHHLIVFCINAYFGGKLINYHIREQTMDILPAIIVSCAMFVAVNIISYNLLLGPILLLIIQILAGAIIAILLYEVFKVDGYLQLRNEFQNKFL